MEDFHTIFDDLKDESLTPYERSLMRADLLSFVHKHPARVPLGVRLRSRIVAFMEVVPRAPRMHPAVLALVLALTIGIGTSYAAEDALPGDPLYAIKINVNEPVQGAFAVTDQAKANWDAQLASRRLQETETLAAQGRLTPQNEQQIEAELAATAQNFDATIADLSETQGAEPQVASARSSFEATLTAHAQVLASLAQALPQSKPILAPITVAVATRAEGEAAQREITDRVVSVDNTRTIRDDALQQQNAAQVSVDGIRVLAENETSDGSGSQIASSTAQSAEAAIETGDQQLDQSRYGSAFDSFQTAVRESTEAQMTLDAQAQLHIALPQLPATAIEAAEASTTTISAATSTSATSTTGE